ncbi:hypothetical protein BDZ91DRAFT_727935 [Kalaharituber pfeilii]|nr:hypothetical protein BDZ91DRAFT_727935 [Kalaharituber pfeilii]
MTTMTYRNSFCISGFLNKLHLESLILVGLVKDGMVTHGAMNSYVGYIVAFFFFFFFALPLLGT